MEETRMLSLSEDLEAFRTTLRRAVDARIVPLTGEIERTNGVIGELWDIVRELEITPIPFPHEVGGSDGTFLAFIVALEELARGSNVASAYASIQMARTLLRVGSPEQIQQWVPRLVRNEIMGSWAFTEPQTGSDPGQIETRAEPDGSDWVLNGQKLFISFAHRASLALVFAKVPSGRIGAFLVDTQNPGWVPGQPLDVVNGHLDTCPVYLDALRVPGTAVVGDVDGGFDVLLATEAEAKVTSAASAVGIAQRALEESTRYALARTHRGTPIGRKFPTIQSLLGDMAAVVLAARSFTRAVADKIDRGEPVGKEAAALKIFAARTAREVTSDALQVCGAYGLTGDMPLLALYREAKIGEVFGGVAEIQRIIVARDSLNEVEAVGSL
jgi:alkylation response protein AidB-like acyl-CoA dehydrogenase